jgi:general stress protein 26
VTDSRAKTFDILKGFSTAMLVTAGAEGRLKCRPMHIASIEEGAGQVWFLTGAEGGLADEVRGDGAVLLVLQNDNSAYLSLGGTARVVNDKAKVKELWKEPYKVWFPGGPEDPQIALVAVELETAEYWDNRGMNKLEYLFEAAKAYIKHETPDLSDTDQHGKARI